MAVASGAETQAVLDELGNEIERLNQENAALRQRQIAVADAPAVRAAQREGRAE